MTVGICDYHLYGRERPHPKEPGCEHWREVKMDGGIATLTPVISDEELIADYVRLMAALDNAKDWRDSLAYGLALFGIRRIMDERGMRYPECPVAEALPKS